MTILISQEHLRCNFERLDLLCARIGHLCENLWPFEFLESFYCSNSGASIRMHLNRTTVWKDMTIGNSRVFPLFNFKRLDILCAWIGHPSEKSFPFALLERIRCSISSISIHYAPKLDIRVKCYDHLNFSRGSFAKFRASRYIMRMNRTSEWKFMTIWISWELPLFNFEALVILCAWIWPPCEKLWPFEFLERFCCSISSISIYDASESDIRGKIYDLLNFLRASIVQFRPSRYIMRLNRTFEW